MSEQFHAWACLEKSGEIKPWTYTPRPLGDDDVEINITHCGICGSDIHQIDSGWGPSPYPIVPGHEIVGTVAAKGANVKEFEIGQRVGVGAQCFSCMDCHECHDHKEPYCDKKVWTYADKFADGNSSYGGYATKVRVHQHFTFGVPDNLSSEGVAPLFCAGITALSPMLKYNVKEGTQLGVVGIGGLGHMAIQWGRALGAHTVAISHSPNKEKEALELGANAFIWSKEQIQQHRKSLDIIVCTANYDNMDVYPYLSLLKTDGRLVLVGVPEVPLSVHAFALISSRISLSGSAIGSPEEIKQMLKIASEKNVVAKTQVFSIKDVNEAIKQFREGKPHFRFVLKIDQ